MAIKVKHPATLLILAITIAVVLIVATQLLNRVGTVDTSKLLSEARVAIAQRDYTTAGNLLDRILTHEPEHALALLERGGIWTIIGKPEEAMADWQNVRLGEQYHGSPATVSQARFRLGTLQLEMHQARQAEQNFYQAWELSQASLQPLEIVLRLAVLQMRRHEILSILDQIESRRPISLEEMVLRVDAGNPIIEDSEAIGQLRTFVKTDKSDDASTLALCRYLLNDQQYEAIETLIASSPADVAERSDVIGMRTLAHLRRMELAKSAKQLQVVPRDATIGYWWWIAASELAEGQQNHRLASDCLSHAVEQHPESGYARYRFGSALRASGDEAAAQVQLDTAAAIDRLHQNSGVIMRMVNMPAGELTRTMMRIARLQSQIGQPQEAARWIRTVLEITPDNAAARAWNAPARGPVADSEIQPQLPATPSNASEIRSRVLALAGGLHNSHKVQPDASLLDASIAGIRMSDVHEAAGLDFQYFNGNSGSKYLIEAMGGGISVLDYDSDGWPDCYFPQGGKIPPDPSDYTYLDQLYRNLGGQRFANVTTSARLIENGYSQGAATADVNNDGFPDVVIANYGPTRLFLNQGDGTFEDAGDAWNLRHSNMSSSVALADWDGDGNLDLYIVNYVDGIRICRDTQGKISTCNPQNFTGVQDRLFRNSGDGRFEDVTETSGVRAEDGKGLGVITADLDEDGRMDIYVANDTTRNFLFKNLGEMQFEEVGLPSGTALSPEGQAQAGMGIVAADLNNDLLTDLFVTNFYFEPNNLYINRGSMIFTDEALAGRVSQSSKAMLGFGAQAEDFDLDGNLDLIVANGHIDDFSSRGEPWKMPTQLFRNRGGAVFDLVDTQAEKYFQKDYLGRGVASLDWNGDGMSDFIVIHQDHPAALLENRSTPKGQGVMIELIGTTSNRDAIGAKLLLSSTTKPALRTISGGDGFYSTNQRLTTLGVGEGPDTTTVEVVWPSGQRQSTACSIGVRTLLIEPKK